MNDIETRFAIGVDIRFVAHFPYSVGRRHS
jgi:hypothetical protein